VSLGQGLSNGVKDVLIFYLKSNLLVDERIFKEFLASYRGQLTPIVTHRFAPAITWLFAPPRPTNGILIQFQHVRRFTFYHKSDFSDLDKISLKNKLACT